MSCATFCQNGESSEIVRGKEKPLRTSFVVRIDVTNTGAADLAFARPTLESSIALPVSRWYVPGTDGQPWDGVLRAHETKRVHVIGYAAEPLQPGARLSATLRFGALSVPLSAVAKKRWDQID